MTDYHDSSEWIKCHTRSLWQTILTTWIWHYLMNANRWCILVIYLFIQFSSIRSVFMVLVCGFRVISSLQLLSHVQLFATSWTAALQAFLSITNSWSLLKLMSIESMMPSNHLIPCPPLLLLPSIFPSIRVFSNESVLPIRWPKYWSFSFSINPFNEYSGLISSRIEIFDLHAVQGTLRSLLQCYSWKTSILQG